MSGADDPTATPAELLAVYADDPAALTAAERRAVEALCAADPAAAADLASARATLAAVRAAAPVGGEPDWARLEAQVRDALAAEPAPRRPAWRQVAVAGGALALAAALALVLWTAARGGAAPGRVAQAADAAPAAVAVAPDDDTDADAITDDELAAELELPDDLGGITVDDELIDEATAALAEDDDPGAPGGEDDVLAPLVPGGAWIETVADELSDDELDRALEWLDRTEEAG